MWKDHQLRENPSIDMRFLVDNFVSTPNKKSSSNLGDLSNKSHEKSEL